MKFYKAPQLFILFMLACTLAGEGQELDSTNKAVSGFITNRIISDRLLLRLGEVPTGGWTNRVGLPKDAETGASSGFQDGGAVVDLPGDLRRHLVLLLDGQSLGNTYGQGLVLRVASKRDELVLTPLGLDICSDNRSDGTITAFSINTIAGTRTLENHRLRTLDQLQLCITNQSKGVAATYIAPVALDFMVQTNTDRWGSRWLIDGTVVWPTRWRQVDQR